MYISRILTNKSALDFLVMFSTNLIKKGFGFVREVILAAMFGSSLIFAQFLLLKIVADLLFQLTQGSALQANIMPRFSRLYEKGEDGEYYNIFDGTPLPDNLKENTNNDEVGSNNLGLSDYSNVAMNNNNLNFDDNILPFNNIDPQNLNYDFAQYTDEDVNKEITVITKTNTIIT